MKQAFFPYRRLTHDVLGEIKHPLIELVLKHQRYVKLFATIDSGAIMSVFPKSVCELLGLEYEEGEKAFLLSATRHEIPVRVHEVTVIIGEIEFKARVGFSDEENIPHVLGRLDVIDKVEIRFERDGVRFIAR